MEKGRNAKKDRKCMFNLKKHAKKAKMHVQFENLYKKGVLEVFATSEVTKKS